MKTYVTHLANPTALQERFDAKWRATESGCHEWTAYIGHGGYGRFKAEGRMWTAHRVAYILHHGEIAQGLEIDHLCRNRWCVNPDHLEAVTKRENQLRSPISIITNQIAKTTCPRGHSNYKLRADGARVCIDCGPARNRRYYLNRVNRRTLAAS